MQGGLITTFVILGVVIVAGILVCLTELWGHNTRKQKLRDQKEDERLERQERQQRQERQERVVSPEQLESSFRSVELLPHNDDSSYPEGSYEYGPVQQQQPL